MYSLKEFKKLRHKLAQEIWDHTGIVTRGEYTYQGMFLLKDSNTGQILVVAVGRKMSGACNHAVLRYGNISCVIDEVRRDVVLRELDPTKLWFFTYPIDVVNRYAFTMVKRCYPWASYEQLERKVRYIMERGNISIPDIGFIKVNLEDL